MLEILTKPKYIYWQDEGMFLGYLEVYPDYWTQGHSLEELQQNLLDIYHEFTNKNIPLILIFITHYLLLITHYSFTHYSTYCRSLMIIRA